MASPTEGRARFTSRSQEGSGCRSRTASLAPGAPPIDEIADGVFSNLEHRYVRNVERPHGLPKPKRQVRMSRNGTSAYLDNFFVGYGVTASQS